jgi:hypothetical protein
MNYEIPAEFAHIFDEEERSPLDVRLSVQDSSYDRALIVANDAAKIQDELLDCLYGEDAADQIRKAERKERLQMLLPVVEEIAKDEGDLVEPFVRYIRREFSKLEAKNW